MSRHRSKFEQAGLTFFNWLIKWEYIEEKKNPFARFNPPTVPKRPKGFLKADQFQALLDLCPLSTFLGARRQSLLWLMMATAIRRLELSLLTVDDLDWDTEEVRVVNGKGQKQRTSPFPTQVQLPMLRYLAHRRHRFPDAEPWLWLTEEGKRLSYNGIYQDLDRLARRAGIRDSIQDLCHIFRRTAGAIAEREGVPRLYTMEKFGWSSSAMLEHYAADMRTEDAEAIQAFKDKDPLGKWFEKGRKRG